MKISRKIDLVKQAVMEVRASIPPDPLAHLTEKERCAIEQYRKLVDPINQYLDATTGNNPAALFDESPITQSMSDLEAQEAYERELNKFNRWFNRRQIIRKATKK